MPVLYWWSRQYLWKRKGRKEGRGKGTGMGKDRARKTNKQTACFKNPGVGPNSRIDTADRLRKATSEIESLYFKNNNRIKKRKI